MARTIGTGTPSHPWGVKRWYTKTAIRVDRGHPEASTDGIWALRSIITGVISTISRKQGDIAFRGPPNSSRSIVSCRT